MNWKTLIAEIQEYGNLTQSAVGKHCGTSQSTISSLVNRDGAQPAFSLGEKLKALHKKHQRKARATTVSV